MSKDKKNDRVVHKHLGREISLQAAQYPKEFEPKLLAQVRRRYAEPGPKAKKAALQELFEILGRQGDPARSTEIYRYYFEHVANDTLLVGCRWSVNELVQSDVLTQFFINRTRTNDKVFHTPGLEANFQKALQLGGGGMARPPTNFPLAECLRILKDYCPKGGTYIDPSCGWGIRLLAAAKTGLKYRGFDVNQRLLPKLNELAVDIQKWKTFDYEVIGQGSEIYVPRLKGVADIVFTSPPYFGIEDYSKDPGQSIVKYPGYEGWKKGFLQPMLKNMFRYLKPGRYCLINIKDYQKFDLIAATQEAAKLAGFEYVGTENLNVIQRVSVKAEQLNQDEDIQVFFKPGPNPFIPRHKRKTKAVKTVVTKPLF